MTVAGAARSASEPILSLRDVSLSFKGVTALAGLSFDVARGEICALIGPNGAGKSSLLNVINGVYRPSAGTIVFAGVRLDPVTPLAAAKCGIGWTFQNNALFKRLSVIENVIAGMTRMARATLVENAFGFGRAKTEAEALRARSELMLEFLEIAPYRDTIVGKLPYGLQKRVELARAIVSGPQLLLLDEPMAGLPFSDKREMSRLVVDINREIGTTVVLIEHDMAVVMEISQHVVVLDYGRKVGDGPPHVVGNSPEVIAAYLGTAARRAA